MFRVVNNSIYHKRGDTADFDVTLTIDGEPVTDYTAVFSVKKTLKDKTYLFQKPVVNGHVRIEHSDTQKLPFGKYFYDIQFTTPDGSQEGRVSTFGAYDYNLQADVTTE